ncbi:hypothetical protein HK101_007293 [Irineochytrium annulatum]|nr:hypothetical protein HK101_007293 [Irineochytrium annulatum]
MEDEELAALRQRRLQEMRGSSGGGGPLPGGLTAASPPGGEEQAEKKAQMEEMRRAMLTQLLDGEARERLLRISMVKADKARAVEDLLIRMAQAGQFRGKISEKMLIDLLEQLNDQQKAEPTVKIQRRRFDDSDDEDLLEGL